MPTSLTALPGPTFQKGDLLRHSAGVERTQSTGNLLQRTRAACVRIEDTALTVTPALPRRRAVAPHLRIATASRLDAQSLRALAMVRSEVAPLSCSSGSQAQDSVARATAAFALAFAPFCLAFAVSLAPARKPPSFLPRRAPRTATAGPGRGQMAFSVPGVAAGRINPPLVGPIVKKGVLPWPLAHATAR